LDIEGRIPHRANERGGEWWQERKQKRKQEQERSVAEIPPGGEAADQTSQCSQSGISALGLRGVVL
jgi:hypothetical protein